MGVDLRVLATSFREVRGEFLSTPRGEILLSA